MPTLPPKDPRDRDKEQFSVNLPKWIIQRIDEIGESQDYARSELIREVLRSFVVEWDEKHAAPSRKNSSK